MDVSREEGEWTQVEEEVEEEEAAATHRRAGGGEEEGEEEEEEEEETVICKVVLGGKRFYLRTWWQADCFDLTLSDARHVWSGTASKEYIEGTLKPPEMPLAEYMRLTRQALTSQDLTKKRFSYKLSASSTVPGDVEFIWRIRLQESAISFSMKGTLPLRRVKDGQAEIQQFFDWFLQRQNLIEKENKQLRQHNERLHAQKEEANTHLNALVEEKVALEQELYKKFVVILNEKKRRIRELKAELTTRPTQIDAPPVTKPKDKKAAASKLQLSSEGGEEEEEASENEARSNGENNKHTFSLTGPTPSFSLLEDETNYNIRTTVRKRRRAANKSHQEGSEEREGAKKKARLPPPPPVSSSSSTSSASSLPAPKNAASSTSAKAAASTTTIKRKKPAEARKSVSAQDLLDMLQ